MKELTAYIYTQITSVHNKVFEIDEVSKDAKLPYITFELPADNEVESRNEIILNVDIWDRKKANYDVQTSIETLTDKVESKLRGLKYVGDTFHARFEKISRLKVPDEDENIRRRQLRFVIKTYFKRS